VGQLASIATDRTAMTALFCKLPLVRRTFERATQSGSRAALGVQCGSTKASHRCCVTPGTCERSGETASSRFVEA
jgi:hypothetical protein